MRPYSFVAYAPLIAKLLAADQPALVQRVIPGLGKYVGLHYLTGRKAKVDEILSFVRSLNQTVTLQILAQICADLANGEGGVMGPRARAWTHDVLSQLRVSSVPIEAEVAQAVAHLQEDETIAHAQVLFCLQQLTLLEAPPSGRTPRPTDLAFLMLAVNDHLPDCGRGGRSSFEQGLAGAALASVFNRTSEDPLRAVVRLRGILTQPITHGPLSQEIWDRIVAEAIGASIHDYVELFLFPLFILSKGWDSDKPPILDLRPWLNSSNGEHYGRWFASAMVELADAGASLCTRGETGLPLLTSHFFRTPFLKLTNTVLCLSPWHLSDHLSLGLWAKFIVATKRVLNTTSIQEFMGTFGYQYESWCAQLARRASSELDYPDKLLLPSHPGAIDEIEDVTFVNGNVVVLISVKASTVPEASLKVAHGTVEIVNWFEHYFFEDVNRSKARGYRGGVMHQLDAKISRIRSGAFEGRGIPKDAVILPVVVTFDSLPATVATYVWLDEICEKKKLVASRDGVRPLTILSSDEYEALLSLASQQGGVCELLKHKTSDAYKSVPFDWFVSKMEPRQDPHRLAFLKDEFDELSKASIIRLEAIGVGQAPEVSTP